MLYCFLQLGFEAKILLNFAGMLDCFHQTLRKLELILIAATDDGRVSTQKCRRLILFVDVNQGKRISEFQNFRISS